MGTHEPFEANERITGQPLSVVRKQSWKKILRRLTSYVCNFWVSGMGPEGGSSENEDMVVCLLGEPYSLVKMLRIVRSLLSIQLCWISPGEMEFKYMQAEAHQHLISQAIWHKYIDKGHLTHETESPRPLHFKHSHWWKWQSRSKFASHYAWGTNGVCECKMDLKSTSIPTWHQMDHVSWSLGWVSKTTSWR
jgi:hypothetical protein